MAQTTGPLMNTRLITFRAPVLRCFGWSANNNAQGGGLTRQMVERWTRAEGAPMTARMVVRVSWTDDTMIVGVSTVAPHALYRDGSPDRTNIDAHFSQGYNARLASVSAMRLRIAICLQLLSLWTNILRPTCRPQTAPTLNNVGSVVGKRNFVTPLGRPDRLCGRTAKRTTSPRTTWIKQWTGSVDPRSTMSRTSND